MSTRVILTIFKESALLAVGVRMLLGIYYLFVDGCGCCCVRLVEKIFHEDLRLQSKCS